MKLLKIKLSAAIPNLKEDLCSFLHRSMVMAPLLAKGLFQKLWPFQTSLTTESVGASTSLWTTKWATPLHQREGDHLCTAVMSVSETHKWFDSLTHHVFCISQRLILAFVSQARWWTVLWSMWMEIMQRRCCGRLGWQSSTSGSSGKTSSWTWSATVSGATTSWMSLSSPTQPCTKSSGQLTYPMYHDTFSHFQLKN